MGTIWGAIWALWETIGEGLNRHLLSLGPILDLVGPSWVYLSRSWAVQNSFYSLRGSIWEPLGPPAPPGGRVPLTSVWHGIFPCQRGGSRTWETAASLEKFGTGFPCQTVTGTSLARDSVPNHDRRPIRARARARARAREQQQQEQKEQQPQQQKEQQ